MELYRPIRGIRYGVITLYPVSKKKEQKFHASELIKTLQYPGSSLLVSSHQHIYRYSLPSKYQRYFFITKLAFCQADSFTDKLAMNFNKSGREIAVAQEAGFLRSSTFEWNMVAQICSFVGLQRASSGSIASSSDSTATYDPFFYRPLLKARRKVTRDVTGITKCLHVRRKR